LTHEEHIAVVKAVIRSARGRLPVIAGTGSNSTAEAVRLTRAAEEAGAAGALLISPYYNRPTQDGIYQHYAAVAEATALPVIVYNIPGRTASNLLPETIARLSRIKNIVGVKEASGSMQQNIDVIDLSEAGFAIWAGDDVMTLPIMAVGGVGAICVTSNVAPKPMADLTAAMLSGDLVRARGLLYDVLPLLRAFGGRFEVNPIPVKTALAIMGRCAEEFRLPLTPMSAANRTQLEQVLREQKLV
jgi:4-hydroxy-tetrahydrodipicolinate synthase